MNGWQVFVDVPRHPPVELKTGESIVGRSRSAQVHIPDSTVSRQHARILVGALGEVNVEDLGSSNGTYVNGEKVEGRRRLADGDRILVGDAELRVRIVAPVASSEATVRMVLPPLGAPPATGGGPAAAPPRPAPTAPAAPPPRPSSPPPAAPPLAAGVPAYTTPFPAQAGVAPPRPVDPPLHAEAAPEPPRRERVLSSITGIEAMPIPDANGGALEEARLARARPAGILVRLVAALVDMALVAFGGVALGALGLLLPLAPGQKMAVVYGLVTGLGLIYPMIFWAIRGATPGKMLLGLSVVVAGRKPGTGIGFGPALMRALGYVASGALFGIGFVLIAFTSQRQGLHDLIAGTRVLRLR